MDEIFFVGLLFIDRRPRPDEDAAIAEIMKGSMLLDDHISGKRYIVRRRRVQDGPVGTVIVDIHDRAHRVAFGIQTSNEEHARELWRTQVARNWLTNRGIASSTVTVGIFSQSRLAIRRIA